MLMSFSHQWDLRLGNENYSEVNVNTPQNELPSKQITIKSAVPNLHQLEERKDFLSDQVFLLFLFDERLILTNEFLYYES